MIDLFADPSHSRPRSEYLGYVNQQVFGTTMAVGFVCHVFMCDCGDTAKEVVKTVGQAFYNDPTPPLANLLPDGRHSGKPTLAERRASSKLLIGGGGLLARRSGSDSGLVLSASMPTSPLSKSSRGRSSK